MIVIDLAKNPKTQGSFFDKLNVTGPAAAHVSNPQIRLWMNQLCTTANLNDLEAAIKPVSWVAPTMNTEKPVPSAALLDAEPDAGTPNCSNWLDLNVTNVQSIDFVQLDRALRAAGFAADRMEIGGISHYRVQADLPQLHGKTAVRALVDGLALALNFRSKGQFVWLDSSSVDADKKQVTMFMRLDTSVDAVELLAGLNKLGYAPSAARLLLGDNDGNSTAASATARTTP